MVNNLANAFLGLDQYGDYDENTSDGIIDELITLISRDYAEENRGFCDELLPSAQVQILLELEAVKTALTGIPAGGVKASKVINPTGANNEILWTAKYPGAQGNGIDVTYVDSVSNNVALSVVVTRNAIVVNLATDGASAPTTTANALITAIRASSTASALVDVALGTSVDTPNTGLGVLAAVSITALTGGTSPA